jgi:SAM-dependent methyltransferase
METKNDPIGQAIADFVAHGFSENITVQSDLCDDDVLPVEYLFRPKDLMPKIEQKALSLAKGRILDVGAAAGCHAYYLKKKGYDVLAIDTSPGAVEHLQNLEIPAQNIDFMEMTGEFDTVLILMNGIGIAGELSNLPNFLTHLKSLLSKDGQALCDSTDLTYLYQEDDGSMWVDLNDSYHGEMQFKMIYKNSETEWFKWLYIDFDLLKEYAEKAGLKCELVKKGTSNNYLVSLTHL